MDLGDRMTYVLDEITKKRQLLGVAEMGNRNHTHPVYVDVECILEVTSKLNNRIVELEKKLGIYVEPKVLHAECPKCHKIRDLPEQNLCVDCHKKIFP